ncbi:MAG: T9SS type A sorting domain-containing protein [Candidatus Marinimicrobia bacterium]|nr:T9SS type A sorting domain-containing protein [Candidatus Neomarinimicrobiota bacterium]
MNRKYQQQSVRYHRRLNGRIGRLVLALSLIGSVQLTAEKQLFFEPTDRLDRLNSGKSKTELYESFTTYTIERPLEKIYQALASDSETVNLQFSSDFLFKIQLEHHSLLGDNFRLRIGTAQGVIEDPVSLADTYSGKIVGDQKSIVRLTVANDYFSGFIKTGNNVQYYIESDNPMVTQSESRSNIRLYKIDPEKNVGIELMDDYHPAPEWYPKIEDFNRPLQIVDFSDTVMYEAEIALIADYAAYANVNSTTLLANELLNILNYTDSYYNQLNITYRLVEIYIVTSAAADPWPDTDDAGVMLSAVDQWVANGGLSNWHDLATFWTGRNFGYSYAWLNTIGDYGRHHLVEFWDIGYTRWSANFQAHEAGHNWGTQHVVHDPQWIMSPSIYYGVINWHSSTIAAFPGFITQALEHLGPVDSVSTPAFLFHQPAVIDDDNQNGIPDPGETFDIQLQVENIGANTSGNTIISLNLSGPGSSWATLMSPSDTVGVMEPFSPVNASHSVSIDQNTPIPLMINLNYTISDGNVSGTISYELAIGRVPVYNFSVTGVNDTGNSNDKFDPGETVVLLLDVENLGEVPGHNIQLKVQPATVALPYIQNLDSTQLIDYLDPNECVQREFSWDISSDFPVGGELELTIVLGDSVSSVQRQRSFIVGNPNQHIFWEDFEYFGLGSVNSEWLQVQETTILAIDVQNDLEVHDEDNGEWDSSPYAGHRSMFIYENWFTDGPGDIRIISPMIDLQTATAPRLSFKEIRGWDNYWPQRKTEHEIWIESSTSSTGPWTAVTGITAHESNFQNWQNVVGIDLSALVGEQIYLSFFTNTHHYYWRIDDFAITDSNLKLPGEVIASAIFSIAQNYPNPFNANTTISYNLPALANATLTVFDVAGQEIITLVNTMQSAGDYDIQWDGVNHSGHPVSAGVYLCRISVGNSNKTIKMVFLK